MILIYHCLYFVQRKIIETVDEARQAATKAVGAAIQALEKSNSATGNLKMKADQVRSNLDNWMNFYDAWNYFKARVSCRDLLQEAEGLQQTSRGMTTQMEGLRFKWKSFIVSIQERGAELEIMKKDMTHLPSAPRYFFVWKTGFPFTFSWSVINNFFVTEILYNPVEFIESSNDYIQSYH